MFCPSCSQTYSSTFKRCPECNCWLKPEEKTAATVEMRGGWSAPPSDVGPVRHLNPFLDVDESEYGWNADTFKMPTKPKPTTDDWVDEEVELGPQEGWKHPDDFEDVNVTVVRPKPRRTGDPTLLVLSAVVGLCLVASVCLFSRFLQLLTVSWGRAAQHKCLTFASFSWQAE